MPAMHEQPTHSVPLPPAPRRVFRRRGWHPLLKLLLYLLIPHVWAGVFQIGLVITTVALATAGTQRPATVVEKGTSASKGTQYWVNYTYIDSLGEVRAHQRVRQRDWDQYKRGSQLTVRTVRVMGLPRSAILGPEGVAATPGLCCFLPFTILWNVIVWSVFAALVGPPLRRRAVVKYGTPTMGRVVSKSTKPSRNGRTIGTVSYEYTGPGIGRALGTMDVTADEYARVREGDAVPVVFTPGVKGGSVIYGFGEYAAADPFGDELVVA